MRRRYLDASCLLFDERRQLLGTVDFSSRFGSTEVGGEDAVEHSGDVLQSHLLEGNHTLHVNLERLEPCVKEVFVTLSAWGDMYLGVKATSLSFRAAPALCDAAITVDSSLFFTGQMVNQLGHFLLG